ncbi:MAG TPA: hypothetical protein VIM11_16265 [Tepidisphaeraceae bacterium]
MNPAISGDLNEVRRMLQELYKVASAKLHAAVSLTEAEPAMAEFLHFAKAYPEERSFVIKLFIDSLATRACPWEFVQFCVYDLRWPEMRDFVQTERAKDIHDPRARQIWEKLLEAFQESWEDAEFYQEYKNRRV